MRSRDTVWNLLSEKIVKPDGTPGMNYSKAIQSSVLPPYPSTYQLAPPSTAYATLPPALVGGPYEPYGCQLLQLFRKSFLRHRQRIATRLPTWRTVMNLWMSRTELASDYYQYLLTGGTGRDWQHSRRAHFL